jgi:hypothetical protein
MRGGYTPDEENQLRDLGVSDYMIAQFASENLAFNDIVQAVHEMQQEGEEINQMQPVNDDDNNSEHSSLHLSDLEVDSLASDVTTLPDDDLSDIETDNEEGEDLQGGRKRKTMKRRKTQKRRTTKRRNPSNKKTRKTKSSQRGGTCYGSGVGANSYDPNFSIYNTRQLGLFPYSTK